MIFNGRSNNKEIKQIGGIWIVKKEPEKNLHREAKKRLKCIWGIGIVAVFLYFLGRVEVLKAFWANIFTVGVVFFCKG